MDRKPARVALNVETSWNGLPMQSVLLLPGERCRPFVIGDGKDASFPVDPDLMGGLGAWTLVESDGTVRVPPDARSSSDADGMHLCRGEAVVIHLESMRFEIRAVSPPRGLGLPFGIDWRALSWASSGVLLSGLAVAVLLYLGPAMPRGVQQRLDAMEGMILTLAGKADAVLARIDLSWPAGPQEPADTEPALPCEPVTAIEVGAPAVAGTGSGSGHGPGAGGPGGQGVGHGIDWSSAVQVGTGQDPGSLLGYGMCMLPPVGQERQE
jgi:hypothetical protein